MYKKIQIIASLFLSISSYSQGIDVVYNDLVWSDEFDQNGAINNSKWHHQTLLPNGNSWYNGEVQHYTNLITNSFVDNGTLKIRAIRENYTNQGVTKQFTSARLNSKFAFTYGRVDIRAKIPTNQGTWPALWLLGKNINEPGGFFQPQFGTTNWPACGEIDIMEHGITPSMPTGYIQSAIHTPSSFGNTVNHGGMVAPNLGNDFHVYTINWSPFQITFLLDGVPFYAYNPAVKNASTWPFTADQYLLLNIAMGGVAGTIPSNFTQATMEIDYIRIYQNTQVDTNAPNNFVANVGNITSNSIELLLNANDNSGSVVYTVQTGSNEWTFAHPEGSQKSFIVPNLIPNTNYVFTVTAKDMSGNQAANNPITLNATTLGATGCSGSSNAAQQGSFSIGYSYAFETINNEVKVTFQLLDTDKIGVVGILWQPSPFSELSMTNIGNNTFTRTLSGLANGTTVNFACKFAFAGGLAVTTYYNYVVGSNCTLEVSELEASTFAFLNPAKDVLSIQSKTEIEQVEIYSLQGKLVLQAKESFDNIPIYPLSPGVYLILLTQNGTKTTKKLIVQQ
ncbi:MAG: family 16 glycosylhydrolase [Flavobacterium sp.]